MQTRKKRTQGRALTENLKEDEETTALLPYLYIPNLLCLSARRSVSSARKSEVLVLIAHRHPAVFKTVARIH